VSAARGQGPLHRRLVRIAGGQPGGRVDAGDPEEEQVRADLRRRFRRGRAAGDSRVLEQLSRGADQDVATARDRGLPVYYSLDEIPQADALPG
jgi:hypothetical protein